MHNCLLDVLILAGLLASVAGAQVVTTQGSNDDPSPMGKKGEMPYEMKDRQEPAEPFLTFEDCSRWTLESQGVSAGLYRSQDQRMFGRDSGKLVYRATAPTSEIVLRAAEPIGIPEPCNEITFWVYGNTWQYGPQVGPLDMSLVFQDANGKEWSKSPKSYHVGVINYQYWWMLRIGFAADIPRPIRLVAIKLSGKKITHPEKDETIYFGPMYALQHEAKPPSFDPFPERLPFPTRPETILPLNKTRQFKNSVHQKKDRVVFEYSGADGKISFEVDPAAHSFDGITLIHKNKTVQPCKGGGPTLADIPAEEAASHWTHRGHELRDDMLISRWQVSTPKGSKDITYRYRMQQKSLVIEMQEEGQGPGVVAEVALGRAEGVSKPKLFRVPMLNFDYAEAPRLLYSDGLFFFTQFDWYYSQASQLYAKKDFPLTETTAVYNGGARYIPLNDGRRVPLRERLFLTVSPDVQEVLPTIPNPPSPMASIMGDRLWMTINCGGMTHEDRLRTPRLFRAMGMENVAVRYHEGTWMDEGESFTFRTDASPAQGGNQALANMIKSVKSLGWLCGLYTNYTDFSPVNPNWNEDWLRLDEKGEWMSSWYSSYSIKPMVAWQVQMRFAPVIHQQYGTNHCYCDVHTAVSPFVRVDFDPRVPGAGTFLRTFECYGLIMLREREAHKGPIYSEGGNHWWYAGLIDGSYANAFPPLNEQPLFVDFDLLKIHPLEMDAGNAPDLTTALTLAYGHIGQLNPYDARHSARQYYMIQPIQRHYAMVPVQRIAYSDGRREVASSEALAADINLAGKVMTEYANGFKTWVNVGKEDWKVKTPLGDMTLPRGGWVAVTPDQSASSLSAVVPTSRQGGHFARVEMSHGPVSHYLDSNDRIVFLDQLAGFGAAAMKRESSGWEIIPATDFKEFGFDPGMIGLGQMNLEIEGVDGNGLQVATAPVRWSRGKYWVKRDGPGAFKYRIVPTIGMRAPTMQCDKFAVQAGDSVQIADLPSGGNLRWVIGGCEVPAQATAGEKGAKVIVPADQPQEERLWLRLAGATPDLDAWLDFYRPSPR